MTPHELALQYVSQGFPVFPCRAKPEHNKHTKDIDAEKTPLNPNGFKGATCYERIINRWWSDWPDALVGIPTGEKSGFFVLDIDCKPGGADGREWLAEMPAIPETRVVITANGGQHIFFNHVNGVRNRGALGDGVDIRGDGGYIIAAGSVLTDGRHYDVEDDFPIADAPDWLLDLLMKPQFASGQHSTVQQPTTYQPQYGVDSYVNAAIDGELSSLAGSMPGTRNNALNDAAFAIGTLVGAGAVTREHAESALQDVARQWDNFPKSCKTINSGLEAGIASPRHIPEPSYNRDDNTRLIDITRMIETGLKKAEDPEPEPEPEPEQDDTHEMPIHATPFEWIDPTTLPRREFVFGTHYIRKYVSTTLSAGGVGKTSNSVAEALSMATGRALIGSKPDKRARVWIYNAEDPRDELERRIMSTCIHYKIKPSDIAGQLFLDTGREQELVIAIDDKRGVRIMAPIVEAVVEQIKRNKIDVMIVDPFVSTHGVNENDNGAIDKVAKLWAHIADRTNCAIDIVHHLRKVADREATVDDARGAVALIGAARSARVLNRMTDDQAAAAGIENKNGYFSIAYGKANLVPLSSRMDWRKLVSIGLGNGGGLTKPQDHAPAVTEWKWPTAEDLVADGADKLPEIKIALDNGEYKAAHNAKPWAGEAIAFVMGMDVEDKNDRRRASMMLKAWLSAGDLVVVEEKDPVHRKVAKFVRSCEFSEKTV